MQRSRAWSLLRNSIRERQIEDTLRDSEEATGEPTEPLLGASSDSKTALIPDVDLTSSGIPALFPQGHDVNTGEPHSRIDVSASTGPAAPGGGRPPLPPKPSTLTAAGASIIRRNTTTLLRETSGIRRTSLSGHGHVERTGLAKDLHAVREVRRTLSMPSEDFCYQTWILSQAYSLIACA